MESTVGRYEHLACLSTELPGFNWLATGLRLRGWVADGCEDRYRFANRSKGFFLGRETAFTLEFDMPLVSWFGCCWVRSCLACIRMVAVIQLLETIVHHLIRRTRSSNL